MTDTNNIIYASAKSMAQAIQDKDVSAVELVDAHLARIEEVNPALNAVVMLAAERARAEAAEADAALARGESKGVLHGVPFTLKDSIDTEGIVTTGGTMGSQGLCAGCGCDCDGAAEGCRRYLAGQDEHTRADFRGRDGQSCIRADE